MADTMVFRSAAFGSTRHSSANSIRQRNKVWGSQPRRCTGTNRHQDRRHVCVAQSKTNAAVGLAEVSQTAVEPVLGREEEKEEESTFVWHQNWFPVCLEHDLDMDGPNKITLLGRDYVVWHANGAWRAAADECPHRFAPLSVGRVEGGQLVCRYHGWAFEGEPEGRCVSCPQAVDARAEATVRESSRSRLHMYPAQVQQGLLWVWPQHERGAWAASAAMPPEVLPEMVDPAWAGAAGDYAFMENPASLPVMLENAMDPSHASYVHNRVISNREDAAPMRMRLSGKIDPNQGFQLEHGGYARPQQKDNMKAKRWFIPPCTIRTEYTYDSGRTILTTLYLVPVKPGVTRSFNKVVFKGVPARTRGLMNFVFKALGTSGLFHAFGHSLVDQDMQILHPQERKLARKARGSTDYNLATESDAGVAAVWRWLTQYGGGGVEWSDGLSGALPAEQSAAQLLNHYDRHTKYCPACQKAVRRLDQILLGLAAASAILGAAALVALPPTAGLRVFGLFLQARILVGALALGLLPLRASVQRYRQRFFAADSVVG